MLVSGSGALSEWRRYWTLPVSAAMGYSVGVLHTYGLGPFVEPLQHEFGWTRAQISGGITVASLIAVLFAAPLGMLVDRFGPRRVGLAGVLVMTLSFGLLGTATGDTPNWMMLWTFIAFGNLGVHATVWTSAVAVRFTSSRGLAFAITLCGASISAAVLPMVGTELIASYGWRHAFMLMGLFWFAISFPFVFFLFHGAQDERRRGRSEEEAAVDLPGYTLAEAFRRPSLYKLILAGGLFTFTGMGLVVHFVPILKDYGATALAAGSVAGLIGLFSLIGRLGGGILIDRLPANLFGAAVFGLPIATCLLLLLDGANPLAQSVAAACLGITVGAEIDIIAYLVAQHLGLKKYGAMFGVLNTAIVLGVALGPLTAGRAFDSYGSYAPFLSLTIGLLVLSMVALISLPRPVFTEARH